MAINIKHNVLRFQISVHVSRPVQKKQTFYKLTHDKLHMNRVESKFEQEVTRRAPPPPRFLKVPDVAQRTNEALSFCSRIHSQSIPLFFKCRFADLMFTKHSLMKIATSAIFHYEEEHVIRMKCKLEVGDKWRIFRARQNLPFGNDTLNLICCDDFCFVENLHSKALASFFVLHKVHLAASSCADNAQGFKILCSGPGCCESSLNNIIFRALDNRSGFGIMSVYISPN
mmetsp:Transcript_22453/g.44099  ORF Transcript_22453/g.44099 Transcript_22453/m.44099 type:complete len:228 (-) Transcript_22453:1703-2386(-)